MKVQEQLDNVNEKINKINNDYDILNAQYKKNIMMNYWIKILNYKEK